MREHAGFAHIHFVCQQTDGQAFQAIAAGQRQRDVEDRGPGQLALAHGF